MKTGSELTRNLFSEFIGCETAGLERLTLLTKCKLNGGTLVVAVTRMTSATVRSTFPVHADDWPDCYKSCNLAARPPGLIGPQ